MNGGYVGQDTNDTLADRWIAAYVRAWLSNEPADIEALFTPNATYRTRATAEPWLGQAAVVVGWLDRRDTTGAWTFRHEVIGLAPQPGAGVRVFVQGRTTYPTSDPRTDYDNLWVIDLAPDGRATAFT